MYFTNGDHRAFESLMRDKPGSDHYDSGKESRFHVQKIVKAAFFCCPEICLTVRQVSTTHLSCISLTVEENRAIITNNLR